ncbi:MAG: PAS domain S-box protein [Methanoregula sp.]|nr:PAS domain S-box protein [Methanoregula sp.]
MMAVAIRVLYVDDNPDLLEIGKLFLEQSGDFAVTTILEASEALLLLRQEKFDAIISDYEMPKMDGLQFLQEVRTCFGQIPFILFTARGREVVIIQAINSGADAFVQKGGEALAMFAELAHRLKRATSRKEAQDLIRKREEEYRYLIEHTDDAVVIIQDGMLRLFNYRTIARTGYSEEELLSLPFLQLIHPDDRTKVTKIYQNRMSGKETTSQYTLRLTGKHGGTIWVEVSVITITWEGRPATINFLIDITDRKWAEELVTRTRRNYETFFNTIREFLFVLDEEGSIIHTNETVTSRLGYTRDELLGQPVLMVYPPDRWNEAGCTMQEMLAGTRDLCEIPLMPKAGQLIPVETRVTKGEWDGKPAIFGVSTDISKLKLSEEKFSLAFRSNASPMALSTKEDGKFIDVNEAFTEMLGLSRNEIIGKRARDLELFVQIENRSNALHMLEETGPVRNLEITIRAKNGSLRFGLFSADSITIGEDSCLLTSMVDITERKLAEDEFRLTKSRLDSALETGKIAWWEMDCVTGNVIFNERKARQLGYPAEQFSHYTDFTKLVHPDDYESMMQGMRDHLTGKKKQYDVTYRIRTRNDEYLWTRDLGGVSEYAPDGKPLKITGFVIDVTERKLIEEALKESELRFRSMFQRHNSVMLLIDPETGKIVDANLAAEQFYGRLKKELCAQSIGEINILSQEEIAAEMQRAEREKNNFFTFPHRLASGEIRTVEVHSSPIDFGGKTILFSIINDITERKRLEENLKDNDQFIQTLIQSIPIPVFYKNYDGTYIGCNKAFETYLGRPSSEIIGKTVYDMAPGKIAEEYFRKDEELLMNPGTQRYQSQVITKNGRILDVIFDKATIMNSNGEVAGLIGVISDITA